MADDSPHRRAVDHVMIDSVLERIPQHDKDIAELKQAVWGIKDTRDEGLAGDVSWIREQMTSLQSALRATMAIVITVGLGLGGLIVSLHK